MFFAKSAIAASLAAEEVEIDSTIATAQKHNFPSHMWTQYTQAGKKAGYGVEVGNQRVIMKSHHKKWVTMNTPAGTGMMANRPGVGPWEKFSVHSHGGDLVSLKADNGKWVTCEAGSKKMTSNRAAIGPWEKFHVVNHGATVSLKSHWNTFVVAEPNGILNCNRAAIGPYEKFGGW